LLEAVVDAEVMIRIGEGAVEGLGADEPGALQQVDEQQRSREELRPADGVRIEKSAYQTYQG